MIDPGIRYFDKIYPKYYLKESVTKHTKAKDKYKKLEEYFKYLSSLYTQSNQKHLKYYYQKKYVIKKENISSDYLETSCMRFQELGYPVLENFKELMAEWTIRDQIYSLDIWLNFFIQHIQKYPMWFLVWLQEGVMKTGTYNIENGTYFKRAKSTSVPFVECYPDCIETIYQQMKTVILEQKPLEDKKLEQLMKCGNFSQIYYYVWYQTKVQENSFVEGTWIKYNKHSSPIPMVSSLEESGTDWCLATTPNTIAREYLERGEMYIYYSYDKEGLAKKPRAAVHTVDGHILEVRGIGAYQNVELAMLEIVQNFLKNFQPNLFFEKIIEDLLEAKKILLKLKHQETLTPEEFSFIEKLDELNYFGIVPDPSITKIQTYQLRKK